MQEIRGLIPELGRSPVGENGNSLMVTTSIGNHFQMVTISQWSCLGNPMDKEAWLGTVHGATESDMT